MIINIEDFFKENATYFSIYMQIPNWHKFKFNIKFANVEYALIKFNKAMPVKINRIVADSICDVLFSSKMAIEKLKDKIPKPEIYLIFLLRIPILKIAIGNLKFIKFY